MHITLTVDEQIAAALKRRAQETGKSFDTVVNETFQAGLEAIHALPRARPYRVSPVSLGAPRQGIDLDKALQLAGELDDEDLASE